MSEPDPAGVPAATPAARWRERGEADPHDDRYDCERARLAGGSLTDDEVANAVYLDPGIANLTIAKDRIRWLSRKLVETGRRAPATLSDIETLWRDLLEKDDRTSPEEYPEMALITFDEFKAAVETGRPASAADSAGFRHRPPASATPLLAPIDSAGMRGARAQAMADHASMLRPLGSEADGNRDLATPPGRLRPEPGDQVAVLREYFAGHGLTEEWSKVGDLLAASGFVVGRSKASDTR